MRVTDGMRYVQVRKNLTKLTTQQADASEQAMTGRRVNAPSSDPVAAAQLSRLRAAQSQTDTYRSTIMAVRGDAETAESALSQAGELFTHLREIAIQGGSDSLSPLDRQALATEVGDVKKALLVAGNAKGARGYLFAGTRVDQPAFDGSGNYQGDQNDQLVEIGPGQRAVVNASGSRAFTSDGGRDVFADVDALELALQTNDATGIRDVIGNLDSSRAQIVREQTRTGLLVNKLETTDAALEQTGLDISKSDNRVGSVDAFSSYTRLSQLAQSLEQAVSVSKTLLDIGSNRF